MGLQDSKGAAHAGAHALRGRVLVVSHSVADARVTRAARGRHLPQFCWCLWGVQWCALSLSSGQFVSVFLCNVLLAWLYFRAEPEWLTRVAAPAPPLTFVRTFVNSVCRDLLRSSGPL